MKSTAQSGRGVAIVGVGNTSYGEDYRLRDQTRTARELATTALRRALEDGGLAASDVDGVVISQAPGGVQPDAAFFAHLGISPAWVQPPQSQDAIKAASDALEEGRCSTVAVLYASEQRSARIQYGGASTGSKMYASYYYYHPWGFSSQGAHWALLFKRHQMLYGSTEEQLGAIAITLRKHALANDDAVMRKPLTIEDYLAARYVCRPLRLLDYCIVNDGGVALILRRADRASGLRQKPVRIAGSASVHACRDVGQLRSLVLDLHQEPIAACAAACFANAGLSRVDVKHLQVYDAFSINIPIALEALGFCVRGEGLAFVQDGRIGIEGELPCNTSGGMLSEAYMHGWNHMVEAVRQLRGQAGARQVRNAAVSMYVFFSSEAVRSILFQRAE